MKITEVAPADSSPSDREGDGRRDGASSSASSSSPPKNATAAGEDAASAPLIPTTQEHWLDQKANIEELYVKKNLILKDVIDIMLEEQGFKATARMYKRQFAKWGWKKYNKAGDEPGSVVAPRGLSRPHAKGALTKAVRARSRLAAQVKPEVLGRLLFEGDAAYQFEGILRSYSEYISGWAESPTPWRANTAGLPTPDSSILQHFRTSLDFFDQGRHEKGGIALRRAFRQIEDVVTHQDVEAIWDCCLGVPQLALSRGRRDILRIFSKYLSQITAAKLGGHPLRKIAHNLHQLAEEDAPENLQQYIERAWKLWIETIGKERGREDPVTIHLKRGYVILMKPEMSIVRSLLGEFEGMAHNMLATHGETQTTATILELEELLVRMYIPLLSAEARARADMMLNGILLRLEHSPKNKGVPIGLWDYVDRYLSFSAHNFLAAIADFTRDFKQAEAHRAMILTAPKDGFWMQTASRLEQYLRDEGRVQEAEEIARQRHDETGPIGHGTFVKSEMPEE